MNDQTRHLLERTLEGINQLETFGCSPSFWDALRRDINKLLRPAPVQSEREKQFLAIRAVVPDFAPEMQQNGAMWGLVEEQAAFFPISSNYVGFYLDDCARKLAQSLFWWETNYLDEVNPARCLGVEYYKTLVPRMNMNQTICRGLTPLAALASEEGLKHIQEAVDREVEP